VDVGGCGCGGVGSGGGRGAIEEEKVVMEKQCCARVARRGNSREAILGHDELLACARAWRLRRGLVWGPRERGRRGSGVMGEWAKGEPFYEEERGEMCPRWSVLC